jgi:glutathione synthase/RimK-type ligase-like ATP-grasp enzyme
MQSIALVTCKEYPSLCDDDRLLLKPLEQEGYSPQIVIWDDPHVDWKQFKFIINRSTWDFYKNIDAFRLWLSGLEKQKTKTFNSISVIRRNVNKSAYLKDLHKRNIPIIPTEFVPRASQPDLKEIMESNEWNSVVVKPGHGGSGYGVTKIDIQDVHRSQTKVDSLLKKDAILIQQYVPDIDEGEYSFIFFGDSFSHCVLKTPKRGEYRTNYAYGGIWKIFHAPEQFIQQARKVLEAVPSPLLYARVDMINVKGTLLLNELELSDPMLFFRWHPPAIQLFINRLQTLINR